MKLGSLPTSNDVNVGALAGIFGDVTNSYKFYWFYSLLNDIQEQHRRIIPVQWLISRMVASAWYPVHYFRLHFGVADKLSQIAVMVKDECGLSIDADVIRVAEACLKLPSSSPARKELDERARYVPFRFIRPFFENECRGLTDHLVNARIAALATQTFTNPSPPIYRFVGNNIELSEAWFVYIIEHLKVLRDFCSLNLVLYLQSKNPNVGNIAAKLNPPILRDLADARKFWQIAFTHGIPRRCVYSGKEIPGSGLSLDHFLPWSFVAHDALWNICPTVAEVNSAKGDRLPALDVYLTEFLNLQFASVQAVAEFGPRSILEDYALVFGTSSKQELLAIPANQFRQRLENVFRPQVQIATNCGFTTAWKFGP